jgi:Kef-type K+ transport system membrane component KefB
VPRQGTVAGGQKSKLESKIGMSLDTEHHARRPLRVFAIYVVMLGSTAAAFFAIRHYGESLSAPEAAGGAPAGREVAPALISAPLLHLLVALAAVIILGRILARLFAWLGQPPVIGEVLAGLCLGPSLLGRVAPELGHELLNPSVAGSLSVVAQLGVILYMFLVGLELDVGRLRRQGPMALAISHASIVAPFLSGAALAVWLYPMLATSDVRFTAFALFLAVAMSVTAFAVLARILTDRRLQKTELGMMALACAATDDVTAWCLLALVVGVAQSQVSAALLVTLLALSYIAFMFLIVRPLVASALPRLSRPGLTPGTMGLLLIGLLLSALATEAIGIHAIFGAFLWGAVIAHDSPLAREMAYKLEDLVTILLLPAFFAYTGLRTQIGLVSGWGEWMVCLAIIAVATLGKFGGTLAAARIVGAGWRDAASLGILMNTRGLMELIVLNVGLDLGVLSPKLFAMMVLMAIATTLATSPLLRWVMPAAVPSNDRDAPHGRAREEHSPAAHA